MSGIAEQVLFIRQLMEGAADVGALLPTSRYTGRAMSSEAARRKGQKRILEVGSGTGPISQEIIKTMQPGDELLCCDINAPFMDFLRGRFEHEPDFAHVKNQVSFTTQSVLDLNESPQYDFIICALPFTHMGGEFTRAVMEKFRRMLKPSGALTYLEYAYMRGIKDALIQHAPPLAERMHWRMDDSVSKVMDDYVAAHEFRRDEVWRNVPPALIHHLRFEKAPTVDVLDTQADPHLHRAKLGRLTIDTDAAKFVAGGIGLAWLMRKRPTAAVLPLAGALAAAWFLRDPDRTEAAQNPDENAVFSACDGKVLFVDQVSDERFGTMEWTRIAAFLDITDVHINRSPIAGRVERVITQQGGHSIASKAGAEQNEAQFTVIEGVGRPRAIVAQRVGAVARRIVNRAKPGALLARGEKFGLIRFGSRTDVYLPTHAVQVMVKTGDTLRGGQTQIAKFI